MDQHESNGIMNSSNEKLHSMCLGVEICVVCGDRASGRHYGAISCEGCKGFFKRSIRKRLGYQCRGNQQCEVTKHHRNRCQYCRLQKCLTMGMRSESVQHERKPISVKKEFPNYTSPFNYSSMGQSNFSSLPYNLYYDGCIKQESANATNNCDFLNYEESSDSDIVESAAPHQDSQSMVNSAMEIANKLGINGSFANSDDEEMESLQYDGRLLEDNAVFFQIQSPSQIPIYTDVHYIYESASRLLFLSVHWVRNVPAFQLFNVDTQVSLIRGCWNELFTLGLSQCSQILALPNIILSIINHLQNSVVQQKISASKVKAVTEHILALQDYVSSMSVLNVDEHEYAYLKLIALFSPDNPSLQLRRQMVELQEKAFQELREQVGEINSNRFARLLLRLPPLRALNRHIMEQIFFPGLGDQCDIENIIPFILKMESIDFTSDQGKAMDAIFIKTEGRGEEPSS